MSFLSPYSFLLSFHLSSHHGESSVRMRNMVLISISPEPMAFENLASDSLENTNTIISSAFLRDSSDQKRTWSYYKGFFFFEREESLVSIQFLTSAIIKEYDV